MFVKARMFCKRRLQTNTWILSGFGNGSPCVSCHCHCMCEWLMSNACALLDITQVGVYTISLWTYFDISSSLSEQKLSTDLLSGRNTVSGFSDCTTWMDVSVIAWITVCFVSRLQPFHRECEARSNLTKSVFHLSLEQTGAGEQTHVYHQCEIPATLIWS